MVKYLEIKILNPTIVKQNLEQHYYPVNINGSTHPLRYKISEESYLIPKFSRGSILIENATIGLSKKIIKDLGIRVKYKKWIQR